jgi:hypothetical protein
MKLELVQIKYNNACGEEVMSMGACRYRVVTSGPPYCLIIQFQRSDNEVKIRWIGEAL